MNFFRDSTDLSCASIQSVSSDDMFDIFYDACVKNASIFSEEWSESSATDSDCSVTSSGRARSGSDCQAKRIAKKRKTNKISWIPAVEGLEPQRFKIFEALVASFNIMNFKGFEKLCRVICTDSCKVKIPTASSPLDGPSTGSLSKFWMAMWAAMPDINVSISNPTYDKARQELTCEFSVRGTKVFHRPTDALFEPSLCSDEENKRNFSTPKLWASPMDLLSKLNTHLRLWSPWPMDRITNVISDFSNCINIPSPLPSASPSVSCPLVLPGFPLVTPLVTPLVDMYNPLGGALWQWEREWAGEQKAHEVPRPVVAWSARGVQSIRFGTGADSKKIDAIAYEYTQLDISPQVAYEV